MATFYSNTNNTYRLRLEVNVENQSIIDNTSNISYALYVENGSSTFGSWTHARSLTIDGTSVYSISNQISLLSKNSELLLTSGTRTINHASDGSKTLSLAASFDAITRASHVVTAAITINTSMVLPTIPRASTIDTFSNFSIGSNPSVSLNAPGGLNHRLIFKIGSTAFKTVDWNTQSSGTITFAPADWTSILNAFASGGTSTNVVLDVQTHATTAYNNQVGSTSSRTVSVSTAASTISGFSNFAIEASNTAGFTINKAYSGYSSKIRYQIGSTWVTGDIDVGVATSANITFNDTQKGNIYGQFTSQGQTSVSITAVVTTFFGTKQIGSAQTASANGTTAATTISSLPSSFSMTELTTKDLGALTVVKNSTLFTHTVLIKQGTTTRRTYTGQLTGATVTMTPQLTDQQQQAIFSAVPAGMSAVLTVEVQTFYNTIRIGTAQTRNITGNFPELKPSFTTMFVSEANGGNTSGFYVRGLSALNTEIRTEAYKYGATRASATIVGVGFSFHAISGTTGALNHVGSMVITGTITDTRGQSFSRTATITFQDYSAPSLTSLSVNRASSNVNNPLGTQLKIDYAASATAIPNSTNTWNNLTLKIESKLRSASTWPTTPLFNNIVSLTDAGTKIYSTYSVDNSYDVRITLTDGFGQTTVYNRVLSTGQVPLSIAQNGIGVGKIWQQGALDVQGDIIHDGTNLITKIMLSVYPVGAIYTSTVSTSPATLFGGTWAAFGAGRVLVGFNGSDTDFNASEKTGGAKTHTLTTDEMPSHTHTQNSHNHTQNAHTHTQNSHNHTQNAHTHTQDPHNHTQNAHSHTQDSKTWMNDATAYDTRPSGSSGYYAGAGLKTYNTGGTTATNNATTATNQNTTATNIATTATNQNTTATNNATTAVNQSTGGGGAHNNLQPYITVYMWKRTA